MDWFEIKVGIDVFIIDTCKPLDYLERIQPALHLFNFFNTITILTCFPMNIIQ